jgi:hypothetical protein
MFRHGPQQRLLPPRAVADVPSANVCTQSRPCENSKSSCFRGSLYPSRDVDRRLQSDLRGRFRHHSPRRRVLTRPQSVAEVRPTRRKRTCRGAAVWAGWDPAARRRQSKPAPSPGGDDSATCRTMPSRVAWRSQPGSTKAGSPNAWLPRKVCGAASPIDTPRRSECSSRGSQTGPTRRAPVRHATADRQVWRAAARRGPRSSASRPARSSRTLRRSAYARLVHRAWLQARHRRRASDVARPRPRYRGSGRERTARARRSGWPTRRPAAAARRARVRRTSSGAGRRRRTSRGPAPRRPAPRRSMREARRWRRRRSGQPLGSGRSRLDTGPSRCWKTQLGDPRLLCCGWPGGREKRAPGEPSLLKSVGRRGQDEDHPFRVGGSRVEGA